MPNPRLTLRSLATSASVFAPLIAAALLMGCSKTAPPEEPVRAVKTITIGADSVSYEHEYAAEIKPRIESRLGFRVAGKLNRRAVEVGQHVNAGQLIGELDPTDFVLGAQASKAQVAAALTNRDLAAADLKRYQGLRDQNFVSSAEIERRDATLQAAQASLDQAQSQSNAQGNQTAYTRLVAAAPGVITSVEAEPGQVLAAGTPLVRIALDGPRDAVFSVPEDKVAQIKLGSPVKIRVWAEDRDTTGTVREIAASADPLTRTFAVKVALPDKEALALGSTVYAKPESLETAGAKIIKLPTSALRQENNASAVWVVDKKTMTIRSQPVVVPTADGNDAVIASGLEPGMTVVVAGVHVLQAGQKVTLYQPPASSTATAASSAAASSSAR